MEDLNMNSGERAIKGEVAYRKRDEPQGEHGSPVSRRQFLEAAAGAAALAGFPLYTPVAETKGDVPRRVLGRTGEKISAIGLGGYHLGKPDLEELESIRIIRSAIDNGITFLDNCWDYNGGESEIRVGKALLDGYRQRAFLMTKIDGRDKQSAARQIEESLRRLQTADWQCAYLQHRDRTLRIREQAFRKLPSVGSSIIFSKNSQSPPQPSPWRPLHTPMFRNLLIADLVLRDRIAKTQWTPEYPT